MNTLFRGKKWNDFVELAFILISIIIVFCGFITFKSETVRWSFKVGVQKIMNQIRTMDIEDLEDLTDELQDMNIYVSPTKVVKGVKNACRICKDAKLSPMEMVVCSCGWILIGSDNINRLENELYDNYLTKKYASYIEAFSNGMVMFVITAILSLIYLVISIITLIGKLRDNNALTFVYGGLGIVLSICNLITISVFNSAFSIVIYDYLNTDKLFVATFSSFIPLLFGVAVILLHVFEPQLSGVLGEKIRLGAGTNMYRPTANTMASQGKLSTVSCPVCGAQVNNQSKFCPSCGGDMQSVAVKQHFCPSCSAQIGEDTMFCPNCGAKCK